MRSKVRSLLWRRSFLIVLVRKLVESWWKVAALQHDRCEVLEINSKSNRAINFWSSVLKIEHKSKFQTPPPRSQRLMRSNASIRSGKQQVIYARKFDWPIRGPFARSSAVAIIGLRSSGSVYQAAIRLRSGTITCQSAVDSQFLELFAECGCREWTPSG